MLHCRSSFLRFRVQDLSAHCSLPVFEGPLHPLHPPKPSLDTPILDSLYRLSTHPFSEFFTEFYSVRARCTCVFTNFFRWWKVRSWDRFRVEVVVDATRTSLCLRGAHGVSSLDTPAGEPLFGYVCSLHKQARLVELVTHL